MLALLPIEFYAQPTVLVARELLGQRLVRDGGGQRLSGLIAETEAYRGADDQASHAYRLTQRSAVMYGPPGRAYVYLIYGRNFCLNAITEQDGQPGAVLIRAIIPECGIETMQARRGSVQNSRRLADGPGKLCQALAIDLALNAIDLTREGPLYIEAASPAPEAEVTVTARIGVRGDEETRSRPWRFLWRQAAHR